MLKARKPWVKAEGERGLSHRLYVYIIILPYDYNEPNNYFIVSQYFASPGSEEKSEPGEMLL